MNISELSNHYQQHSGFKALVDAMQKPSVKKIFASGVCASSVSVMLSCLKGTKGIKDNFVFILSDAEEAGYFYHDLTQILGEKDVLFFPSSYRKAIKYHQKDAGNEILRTDVLSRLQAGENGSLMIVTYPEALAEKVISKADMQQQMFVMKVGENHNMTEIEKSLIGFGFQRTDYVYEPGQFAVRGSILDIFSFSSEYPYRIDFFGDEIDSIRVFDVQSQLSSEKRDSVTVVPELNECDAEGISFFKFAGENSWLVMHDDTFVVDFVDKIYEEGFVKQAVIEQGEDIRKDKLLLKGSELAHDMLGFRKIEYGISMTKTKLYDAIISFDTTEQPIFHKNFDLVYSCFSEYLDKGYTIYILADSQKQIERLGSIFEELSSRGRKIEFTAINKTIHSGFTDNTIKACFFTDHQLFDRFHKYNLRSDKARSGKVALSLKEINQFEPGDYVVHVDHGIGQFAGLVRVPNGDKTQEMIKLVYGNNDVVFVSIHSLHKVSKYKSKDGEPPRLNKLGTGAWEKLKDKTKTKIKDIARDLIKLYSKRKEEKGFAFSADTFMQHELEASFLYEDTPDQLKATNDVKADMEKDTPMDRLICGDVGFGKTEVAMRAAFKACCDNKQVAVLVPTTVLAYQHFQSFKKRMKDFPVTIEYLSRARTATDTKDIIRRLATGEVNIVVGTHKLIGKNVKFKDLGLLIIDEEQKFGVSTKEKLRQIKTNVDTLAMSATPIPRTLQFSLIGARDLSVIQTPPPNRYPIQTELHTYGHEVIADAIKFELSRNGQVYFVNNRINGLVEIEKLINKYVPEARVCVAHGQMPPEKLEQIIYDFVNYDYDVLLSTTIIESGIDIPNANTIIINQAQHFGLSDLHQMRGRVGRSNKKAFCYLLAPPLSALPQESRRRLQAIENFSDLGSGIHIAMQDLDIRGAGNMLGAEQSGFIADLGYETYQKILKEAVKELKNDEFADVYAEEAKKDIKASEYVTECNIESDIEMLFPELYIPSSSERMLLYRELDGLDTDEQVDAYKSRLEDRFGQVPQEGMELLRIVALKRIGRQLGIERILLKQGSMSLYFVNNTESPYFQSEEFGKIINYITVNPRRCQLRESSAGKRSIVIKNIPTVEKAVEVLRQIIS